MRKIKLINKVKTRFRKLRRKYKIIKKHLNQNIEMSNIISYMLKSPKRFLGRFNNNEHKIAFLINSLLSSKIMIAVLVIILSLKAVLFYDSTTLNTTLSDFTYEMTLIFMSIFICPLLFIKKDKRRFRWIIIYDIFFSILLFADCAYFAYSSNMLSISQIFYIKYAEEIKATLLSLLNIYHILYFIDILIILALWFFSKSLLDKKKTSYAKNRGRRRIAIGILFTASLLVWTNKPIDICFEKMAENPYLKLRQVGMGSVYGYHVFDIYNAINIKETAKYKTYNSMIVDYEKLAKYKDDHFEEDISLYGIAKDKNVIIIQLESVQNFVINQTLWGQEITPNLNKFFRENIQVTNMMVQSYSTTADSEYSAITSLYPLDNGQAYSMYYGNINNDMFTLYQNEDYTTYYMHGNVGEFWNRHNVYSKMGVDKISFIDDFEDQSEIINEFLSDELFYKQSIEKLAEEEEKFCAFLVAASSHTPFTLEGIEKRDRKVQIDVGIAKNTYIGNYIEAMNYADYAFGILIEKIKEEGLYDDSVILVFGDHAGLMADEETMEYFLTTKNPNYNKNNNIDRKINYANLACGIKIPGIASRSIENVVSKIDIKPTLLYLSGIEDNFSLGKTFFSTKDYAYINNGNIVLDKYYYDGEKWYLRETGEVLNLDLLEKQEEEKLTEYAENIRIELDISSAIAINDLLKK